MQISEVMTRHAVTLQPGQTLNEAAEIMERLDTGFVPVGENDQLVGTLTDRDIVLRAVAKGMAPDTEVRKVMSSDVFYCFDDEDTEAVAANMGENQVRRMPVVNRDKRLVGVVSLGDLATGAERDAAGKALEDISD